MTTLTLTPYQAKTILAALEVFRIEQETALYHSCNINESSIDTNKLLTCINANEEAAFLQNEIAVHFGISTK